MNLLDKLQDTLLPLAQKLDNNKYLAAIKNGFFAAMPLLIIGSIFLLITQIPIKPYLDFMAKVLGDDWMNYFLKVNSMAMDIMSLYVIFGISKHLGEHYGLDGVSAQTAAVFAFLIITPVIGFEGGSFFPIGNFGAAGLFVAMIAAILAVEVFRWVADRGWTIKMPDSVPSNVARSFEALIPALIVAIVFNFIRIGFEFTQYQTAHNFILEFLQKPLLKLGGTLPAFMLLMLLESLFWSFGIHGSNIIGNVMLPVWATFTVENAEMTRLGLEPLNIFTNEFYGNFIKMGGAGGTIGLALSALLFSKAEQYRTLSKLAIGPALFNINEPLIFGVPIVLNPIMLIPFILVPQVLAVTTYFAMSTGLVPKPSGVALPWTTPPIISGLLLTGWRGAVLQVVNLGITFVLYYTFFKIVDTRAYEVEQES